MQRILITGATGNIGVEVIRFLYNLNTRNQIVAAVRDIAKAKVMFKNYPSLQYVTFDFENSATFESALMAVDRVFLLRPPHIADVDRCFKPLIDLIKQKKNVEIVFLSVQGAEKSKFIPHHKMERLINNAGLNHIYLRPSYFMQNLTTTLYDDIKTKREIVLVAAKAKFNWVDVENIAEIAAILLTKFEDYKNQALEITGSENANFYEVANLINTITDRKLSYKAVNPLYFYKLKKHAGMPKGLILVLIMLHFLPRFQSEPIISDVYERLTAKKPTDLKSFLLREKKKFE